MSTETVGYQPSVDDQFTEDKKTYKKFTINQPNSLNNKTPEDAVKAAENIINPPEKTKTSEPKFGDAVALSAKDADKLRKDAGITTDSEKTETTAIDKKLPDKLQDIQRNIKALEKALELLLKEEGILPKDEDALIQMKTEKEAKLKEGIELNEGEISPETRKKEEIINQISIRALNPQNGQNRLENDKRVKFTREDVNYILYETEGNETQKGEKLKTYLINSLEQTIKLNNEAKYGKGTFAKVKKFFNEGYGGAAAKTILGGTMLSSAIGSGLGIFAPGIAAMGAKLAAEGVTQAVQELTQGNKRKELLQKGKIELQQKINQKIKELNSNPELANNEKYTQAMLEWIESEYAQEVTNLVDQDVEALRDMENIKSKISTVGSIASMLLIGFPADFDADKITHFVNIAKGVWYQGGSTIARSIVMNPMNTFGIVANLASVGIGTSLGYIFGRGMEGDEKKFKLGIDTEKYQKTDETREKTRTRAEEIAEVGTTIPKTEPTTPDIDTTPPTTDTNTPTTEEKTEQAETPSLSAPELAITKYKQNSPEAIIEDYQDPSVPIEQKNLALTQLIAKHPDKIDLSGNDPADIRKQIDNTLALAPLMQNPENQKQLKEMAEQAKENVDEVLGVPGVWISQQEIKQLFSNWVKVGNNEYKMQNDGKWRVKNAGVQGIPGVFASQETINKEFGNWVSINGKEYKVDKSGKWRVREVSRQQAQAKQEEVRQATPETTQKKEMNLINNYYNKTKEQERAQTLRAGVEPPGVEKTPEAQSTTAKV